MSNSSAADDDSSEFDSDVSLDSTDSTYIGEVRRSLIDAVHVITRPKRQNTQSLIGNKVNESIDLLKNAITQEYAGPFGPIIPVKTFEEMRDANYMLRRKLTLKFALKPEVTGKNLKEITYSAVTTVFDKTLLHMVTFKMTKKSAAGPNSIKLEEFEYLNAAVTACVKNAALDLGIDFDLDSYEKCLSHLLNFEYKFSAMEESSQEAEKAQDEASKPQNPESGPSSGMM